MIVELKLELYHMLYIKLYVGTRNGGTEQPSSVVCRMLHTIICRYVLHLGISKKLSPSPSRALNIF